MQRLVASDAELLGDVSRAEIARTDLGEVIAYVTSQRQALDVDLQTTAEVPARLLHFRVLVRSRSVGKADVEVVRMPARTDTEERLDGTGEEEEEYVPLTVVDLSIEIGGNVVGGDRDSGRANHEAALEADEASHPAGPEAVERAIVER